MQTLTSHAPSESQASEYQIPLTKVVKQDKKLSKKHADKSSKAPLQPKNVN